MLVRSQRQSLHSGNTGPEVGPGTYALQDQPNPKQRFGCAPFGSTSLKLGAIASEAPGPGAYAPPVVAPLGDGRSAAASFASRSTRFATATHTTPGPGTYDAQLPQASRGGIVMGASGRPGVGPESPASQQQQQGARGRNDIQWVKVASAPSIPSGPHFNGYEEGPGGALVQQPAAFTGHDGTPRDKAGPGEYDPSYRIVKPAPLTSSFAAQHGQRSNPVPADSVHKPGPGHYSPKAMHTGPSLATAKSCFNSHTQRIFVPGSDQPGPGEYDVVGAVSTFKDLKHYLAAHPESFHAFGSSSVDPRAAPRSHVPGPGAYDVAKPTVVVRNRGVKHAVFNSATDRFTDAVAPLPGPGAYEVAEINSLQHKLASIVPGRFGGFGSTATRFAKAAPANESTDAESAPQSRTASAPNSGVDAHRRDVRTSAFRPVESVVRAPAQQQQEGPNYPDLRRLPDLWQRKSFTTKPSLLTSGPRLMSSETDIPGPGSYTTNSSELKGGGVRFARDRRFHRADKGKDGRVDDGPGPGQYFASRSWNKPTFNVTFTGN